MYRLLPPCDGAPAAVGLAASMVIPARRSAHSLVEVVEAVVGFLPTLCGPEFEVLIVPNGDPSDPTSLLASRLSRQHAQVRAVALPPGTPPGKGAAVRQGLLAARGERVMFTDADLPYELEFFREAFRLLDTGHHLVTANRRLPQSVFEIPVPLLRLAYARHRQGRWFNAMVRAVLPIESTDTQAGIKALSRTLCDAVVPRIRCPGFLFDLEVFLTAHALGLPVAELPVRHVLRWEESTVETLREGASVLYWLSRIAVRYSRGAYGPGAAPGRSERATTDAAA